jgi:hypothetical protein
MTYIGAILRENLPRIHPDKTAKRKCGNTVAALQKHSFPKRIIFENAEAVKKKLTGNDPGSRLVDLDGAAQLGHHRSMETRCAQCGAAMTCRPEGGCWCAELPHVPVPANAEGCLCRTCLRAKIESLQISEKQKEA